MDSDVEASRRGVRLMESFTHCCQRNLKLVVVCCMEDAVTLIDV